MKTFCTLIILTFVSQWLTAATLTGRIVDKANGEPLIGAAIIIDGTSTGTITDYDGNYTLTNLPSGKNTIRVSYVSYQSTVREVVFANTSETKTVDFALQSDDKQIDEVAVVARKNLETENALMQERRAASVAIENIGAREMAVKGVSNAEDGVKKLTGISIASAGQLIVRGLGDRYSTTTLNKLPIASPNPDNKLIPLDIFPSSTIKNITVSKVYEAGYYADYSGAHVDISTRENTGDDFFNVSVSTGGKINTVFQDFRAMDSKNSLWGENKLSSNVLNMSKMEFEDYVKTKDVFGTDFSVDSHKAHPDLSAALGFGKTWSIGQNKLSLLTAASVGNELQTINDAFATTLEAGGNTLSRYQYNSYENELKQAALANIGYSLRSKDRIAYTLFFARNATNTYMLRNGFDYEDHILTGSNNVSHIYSLLNHQLMGHHEIKKLIIDWSGSYGTTASDEPDRRQVMFVVNDNSGLLELFKLNQQETMRYFGTLDEDELNGNVQSAYNFSNGNKLKLGFNIKDKSRDYQGTRFYYKLHDINPVIDNVYNTDDYLNFENIANGNISVDRNKQPKDTYKAGNTIYAAFIETDIDISAKLHAYLGLRFENSQQWVDYSTDGGRAMRSELNSSDLFPTINIKYSLSNLSALRLALSRTVTRPSFIEIAPFLYQESYGAAQIRGNADLKNGYNYNIDLRYERITNNGDILAATLYYKLLQDPIERIQRLSGGAAVHSFQNASNGQAAGIEIEARKHITKELQIGANASFMYTDVKLPEGGGSYTNSQRALQGASPYLGNADITYTKEISENKKISLALLYNIQGQRIHAVGIAGLGDIKQKTVNTLNFNANMKWNKHFQTNIKFNDILDQSVVFKQNVPTIDKNITVEKFKKGLGVEIGIKYEL